jgi:hypothetical protein
MRMGGFADASPGSCDSAPLTPAKVSVCVSSLPVAWLFGIMLLYLGADQIWLLRFLGLASSRVTLFYAAALMVLCAGTASRVSGSLPWPRIALCMLSGFVVLLLGGEGHVFYANIDWQVRDAVLRDMIRFPWPFAYGGLGSVQILRAPIGMYLVPALLGKALGVEAAHYALLLQNSMLVGGLLSLGSLLFATSRARRIALCVVLAFSGMDTIGMMLVRPELLWPLDAHIEGWAAQLQYSSMITLAFWVPQHAISGWLGGLLFLLWQRRLVPLGAFLAAVPFCALWSPLGVMGTLPFALLAGLQSLVERRIRWTDILAPAGTAMLVMPSLLYMGADFGTVGARIQSVHPIVYVLFELVEVVPVLALAALLGGRQIFGRASFFTVAACLAFFPFILVGENSDFVMRASIPALMILSITAADRIANTPPSAFKTWLIIVLAIGALTPARELYRAIVFRATPYPACDVAAAWQESFSIFGMHTYFARVSALPPSMQVPDSVASPTKGPCYSRAWKIPRWS